MDRYALFLSVVSTLSLVGLSGTVACLLLRAKPKAVAAHSQPTKKPAPVEGWTTNSTVRKTPRSLEKSMQKPVRSVEKQGSPLTESQLIRVLELCAAGQTNQDIAATVGCTPTHVSRIRNATPASAKVRELVYAWIERHPEADLHRRVRVAHKKR